MPSATPLPAMHEALPEQKLPSLYDFFHPGGLLAKSSLAFEHRPGQYLMAKTIEQCFADRRHLIAEAGTGTGKTLAYLLPALRRAREQKQRIIISTGTKNLQEQLYFKDIPFLESLLGPLKVCYMKGRANYLCKQKLYALRDNPILSGLEEIDQFHHILKWERTTETGDRSEIDALPEQSPLWHKLDARSEVCLGQSCPNWEPCFVTGMRRKALESDIVIVNHHLFFADLSIKQQAAGAPDAGILPEAAAVIFDEAHELEDVASQYFGIALSNARFDELARDTESMLRAKGVSTSAIESATQTIRERSKLFFGSLPAGPSHLGRLEFIDRADFLESRGDAYLGASNALQRLEGELERLREVEEAAGLRKRAADIRHHMKFLLESEDPNTVFWIERRATSGLRNAARNARLVEPSQAPPPQAFSTHLQATPIDVSTLLAETLFTHYPSVILTSATLTVAGADGVPSFAHLKKRLGIPFPKELVVPSHFDYAKQALLYLPPTMPDPRHADFIAQATEKTRRVLEISRGRAFCLFTSYAQMREMHERLLAQLPYPLLMQGSAPRHVLLQQFRETPNAVLFGTSSFWQGIDVQGEQLSCVIIDKLPFAVPTDPIMKARTDAITAAGGNAFNDLQVPQAVIALKQGFGRLIRSLSDRGVLMLLDPRIRTTRYGATFLDSLPPYRRTEEIGEVEKFFEAL
ncbi:ATP-dependent DNA helicase [Granulicella mallensis]|uniref:DNA 5'-3' helicase n=1 Tax=Granulicella mallensis (strain ATCC BAA-1857 / DSM 23137 / MP5ACTX8) TaxID=682795 RepID=G8NYN0_GRAMM|nr:helicase C-terminal domain-containing protein [Granulicella mallensis]AEU39089.1 DEAD/DEAH box helicase domain protein [Granulicella mallensis MP5ACTX8]